MALNSTEIHEMESHLGTTEGKTMDDYFEHFNKLSHVDISVLKTEFKAFYPDITDWSF